MQQLTILHLFSSNFVEALEKIITTSKKIFIF